MKLDSHDISILQVLLKDGRASFRDVATQTSLTTPTVSYRVSRMLKSGFIKKFVPVMDQDMANPGVNAFVTLRTKPGEAERVCKKISAIGEVSGVFLTTGKDNVVLKVHCDDSRHLRDLLNVRLPKLVEAEMTSSQLIVTAVKDEQPVLLGDGIFLELRCDYCKGEVASNRPYNIRVGSTRHYFCCRTCRREFLTKYGRRIERINAARET